MGPAEIFGAWMERVWNQGDLAAIDELLAADAPIHGLGEPLIGPPAFREFRDAFGAAFDEIQISVVDQVVDGDRFAARWEGTMRHRRTGEVVPTAGMAIATVRDGKVREGWNSADFLPMLIQLGLVSPDAVEKMLA